jgi:hypothetical protein
MNMSLEQLQQKLEGVFDLTSAVDCQSVIRALLRDLDRARGEDAAAQAKLRILASLVSNGKPSAKEVAQGVLEKTEKRSPEDVMDFLFCMCDETTRAEKLDDKDLVSDAVKAWAELDMHSRESAVIDELTQRFKAAKGIKDAFYKVPKMPKQ